jgi:hypothetical protein
MCKKRLALFIGYRKHAVDTKKKLGPVDGKYSVPLQAGLEAKPRQKIEEQIQELEESLARQQRTAIEKKFAARYHKVLTGVPFFQDGLDVLREELRVETVLHSWSANAGTVF